MKKLSNTEHHIQYVEQLLQLIAFNGDNHDKHSDRVNKLIYCTDKLAYNISSGRTTKEYVWDRLQATRDSLKTVKYYDQMEDVIANISDFKTARKKLRQDMIA